MAFLGQEGNQDSEDQEAPSAEVSFKKGFPTVERQWKVPGPIPAATGPASVLASVNHSFTGAGDSSSKEACRRATQIAIQCSGGDKVPVVQGRPKGPPPIPGVPLPLWFPGKSLITCFIYNIALPRPTPRAAVGEKA